MADGQREHWRRPDSADSAARLVREHYREIYVFLRRQTDTPELAEDLTQEVFVKALSHLHSFDARRAGMRTWVYRIATNLVIDHRRSLRTRRRPQESLDELPFEPIAAEPDAAALLEQRLAAERLHAAIDRLPVRAQQIVRMKSFAEHTFPQIAAALDIPEATAKTTYYRALARLREELHDA